MLVNYVNSRKIKQLNHLVKIARFLHGLDNLQNLVYVGAIRRFLFSLFVNQNISQDRKVELLCKSIVLVSEILFHGLPSKSKRPSIRKQIAMSLSSQLIVL